MATRAVLAALVTMYAERSGVRVVIESVGGVDAAKRVAAGESFDLIVLAADAIAKLAVGGHVVAASEVDVVASGVAVAVRRGTPHPAIDSEDAVRAAVRAARRPSCSTGPSGVALTQLFARWGIADEIADRLVQARPGISVGSLLAQGESDLGFQQLSELLGVDGIDVLGPLPAPIQVTTIFSAAVGAASSQVEQARAFLDFLASEQTIDVKLQHGMEHVPPRPRAAV